MLSKRILNFLAVFVFGMAGGIFGSQIIWPYFIERPLFLKYNLNQPPIYINEEKRIIIKENTALQEAIENIRSSVVRIKVGEGAKETLKGGGLIATSDGLVVTLAKLAPDKKSITLFADGERYSPTVLKKKGKLALLKLKEGNFTSKGFADFDKVKLGERIFIVNPAGDSFFPLQKFSVDEGIIKNFSQELIQTNIRNANITPGSPIFDIEGNFLGLTLETNKKGVLGVAAPLIKDFIGF